jgi:hypothetical protein
MPCCLYIRILDAAHPSHPGYHRLGQAGDVIFVAEADHVFGKMEIASDEHLILKIEDMTRAEAELHFLAEEKGDLRKNPNLRRRIAGLSLALLPGHVRAHLSGRVALDLSTIPPAALRTMMDRVIASDGSSEDAARHTALREFRRLTLERLTHENARAMRPGSAVPSVRAADVISAYKIKAQVENPFVSGVDPFDFRHPKLGGGV